jgi:esterase/lipase
MEKPRLFYAFQNVSDHFSAFDVPFLIIHGSTDKICAVEGSQNLLQQSPSKDKQIKVIALFSHHVVHTLS